MQSSSRNFIYRYSGSGKGLFTLLLDRCLRKPLAVCVSIFVGIRDALDLAKIRSEIGILNKAVIQL